MLRTLRVAFALIAALTLGACSKEDPNPELRDPIYADLGKRQADAQKAYEEASAKIKELVEKLEKAEANSLEKRDMERDLRKYRKVALDSEQMARYYKIRVERRRIVDKAAYREALEAKKEWPYPDEYSDYLTNRRLHEISLNWNARVPKLTDRLPSSAGHGGGGKKEGKAEGKKSGH